MEQKIVKRKSEKKIHGYLRWVSTKTFCQWESTDKLKGRQSINQPGNAFWQTSRFRLCSLWSLCVACCSASVSLCTAQSTWFQVFFWASAELAFHVAEGQSITIFPCPMTHVPDGDNRPLSGLPVSQIWLLALSRKKTGVDVGCWHVIDTILWSEWKICLLDTNKRGEV